MLNTKFQESLQNEMQNNLVSNLKQNQDLMNSINDPNVIEKTIAKFTKILSKKISKKKSVRSIITHPNNPSAKPVNVQNQVRQVMTRVVTSNEIAKVLFNIESSNGPIPHNLRNKVIQAITAAFEQIYLHESTPVINELYTIAMKVRNRSVNNPNIAYKSGKIQNIVRDANRLTNMQKHEVKRNQRKVQQIKSQVKNNTPKPKINIRKMITKEMPADALQNVKNINRHIAKVKNIERYLKAQFIKHKHNQKNTRKLIKVYLKTKKAEKILQNKKLNSISKNLISSVQRNIHRIRTLKHNVRNIRNPENRRLAMKLLFKQVDKTKTLLNVVAKINHHIKKNINKQRKYQRTIQRYNGKVPVHKQPYHKIAPQVAQKAVHVLAKNISTKLQNAGCRVPHVQRMLKNINKIAKIMTVNPKNAHSTHREHHVKHIPGRINSRNTHTVAQRMKKALNIKKHLSHAHIHKASTIIAHKMIRGATNKKVATKLAKKFAINVLRDPKASSSAKKLAIRVYKKVLRSKLSHSNKPKAQVHRTARKQIKSVRVGAFVKNIVKRILHKANDPHHAKRIAKRYALKIMRMKKVTPQMKKIAIHIYHLVKKVANGKKARRIVKKSIHKIGKAVLKAHIPRGSVKHISKNISKTILRNASSPAKAKKLARNFALKILKNPRATKAQRLVALKVYKNVRKNIIRKRTISNKGTKALRKISHVIPSGHLNNRKAKHAAHKMMKLVHPHRKIPVNKVIKLSNAIAHKILRNSKNHHSAKKLAKHFLLKVLKNKHSTGSAMVMANRVFQTVKRHIKYSNKAGEHHRPAHSKKGRAIKSIAHRIVNTAKNPRHAKHIARKLVLRILKNPRNSRKTKKMAMKIYRNVNKILRNRHHSRRSVHRVRHLNSHKFSKIAHHSAKRAAKILKRAVNVKAHYSKKNSKRMSKIIAHKILKSSKNIHHAAKIARKFVMKVLIDKKASKSAKKMALKVYKNVHKKLLRKSINRHIHRNSMHNLRRVHTKKGVKKAVHTIKRKVNNKSHINGKEIKQLSKNIVKKILKASSNVNTAHKIAKKFAIKILRDRKSTRSMKKMAIRVFRNLKKKIAGMNKNAKRHFNQRHSRHHMRNGHKNTHGQTSNRHHRSPRRVNRRVARRVVKRMSKKMSVHLKKNISARNINRLSGAMAKKILRVARSKKVAKILAKRFVMKVLRNPKATRSMKIMAIRTLRKVRAHKKHHQRHHQKHHQRHHQRHQNVRKHISEVHQVNHNHPNHPSKPSKRSVKKNALKLLKTAGNLKNARKLAKTNALKVLRNPQSTLKQKKEALSLFSKVKKIITTHKKNVEKKALKSIPAHISEYDVKKVSVKILKSINNMTKHHKINELKKVTEKITNSILQKSDSVFTSKKIVATMIKKIVNNRGVNTAAKQMLNNIATKIIQKTKKPKKN